MMSSDEIMDVAKATLTLITTSIGAGILSIPYGFAIFGWWAFPLILFVSILMLIGGLLLNENLKVSKSFAYVDLAEEHLGPVGKWVFQCAFIVDTYFVAIIFLILCASSFQAVFANVSNLDYQIWVIITVAAMWPVGMLTEVKDMAGMLLFASICSYSVAVIILAEAGSDRGEPIEYENPENVEVSTGIQGIAIFLFAYTFNILVPSTRRNMKYPKNMHWPIILVSICLLTVYTLVGALNHGVYGCEIPSNILTKWDRNIPWYLANILVGGHLLVAGPLVLHPFVIVMERWVLRIEIDYTQNTESQQPVLESEITAENGESERIEDKFEAETDKTPVNAAHEDRIFGTKETEGNWLYRNRYGLGRIILRTFIWASILLVALLIPFFSDLEEAVVGLALVCQSIAGPIVIYWAIHREELSLQVKVTFAIVVLILSVFAVAATYYAVYDIVEAASSFRVFHVPPSTDDYLCGGP
eukprot:Clim_evm66s199 gene=Clim_evmTU66s199